MTVPDLTGNEDRDKQARAELRAEQCADKRIQLSGYTYVSAMLRDDVDKRPWRAGLVKLPAATPDKCHHGITICSLWECLESWAIDYRLYLHRTAAGRTIAAAAGWDSTVDIPATPEKRVPDPKLANA
jgi:hypothetical protein